MMWGRLMNILQNKKLISYGALIFTSLLLIDIIIKNYIYNNIYVPIYITSFFNIDFVLNRGVSFGIFSNLDINQYVFLIINIIVIIFLYFIFIKDSVKFFIAWVVISAGAIGNAVDRVLYNGVVDFLDFHMFNIHFPSFNTADVYITLGIIYIIYIDFKNYLIKKYENK